MPPVRKSPCRAGYYQVAIFSLGSGYDTSFGPRHDFADVFHSSSLRADSATVGTLRAARGLILSSDGHLLRLNVLIFLGEGSMISAASSDARARQLAQSKLRNAAVCNLKASLAPWHACQFIPINKLLHGRSELIS
jgi:hypothetical protein